MLKYHEMNKQCHQFPPCLNKKYGQWCLHKAKKKQTLAPAFSILFAYSTVFAISGKILIFAVTGFTIRSDAVRTMDKRDIIRFAD